MMELLKQCSFVITDSGGLQKESYFFAKHCLVVRDETEWTELTELDYNFLIGADKDRIVQKSMEVEHIKRLFDERPYGNGDAANKIARILGDV
jgi:UDP-GlcNAc3NAcA epimerase